MTSKRWKGEVVCSHTYNRPYVPKETCVRVLKEKDAEIARLLEAAQRFIIATDQAALTLAEEHGELLATMASVRGTLGKEDV